MLLTLPLTYLEQKLKVLEKEMADAEARLEEAKGEAEEVGEEWAQKRARLQGDFDNFRARHVNQTLEAQLDARIKVLTEFLPVLDNFDRARASISPAGDAEDSVNAQYEQLHDALMTSLGELGMERIDAVGQEFDYNTHVSVQFTVCMYACMHACKMDAVGHEFDYCRHVSALPGWCLDPAHAIPGLMPALTSPRLASPHLASPRLASPRLASPRLASPHLASPRLASPHLTSQPSGYLVWTAPPDGYMYPKHTYKRTCVHTCMQAYLPTRWLSSKCRQMSSKRTTSCRSCSPATRATASSCAPPT